MGGTSHRLASLLFFLPSAGFAAAWNQPKGGFYSKLLFSYGETTQLYNDNGDPVDLTGRYRSFWTLLYTEYGVRDRVTVHGLFPFFRRDHLSAPDLTATNPGDVEAGFRVNLVRGYPVSFQVNQSFPTGDETGGGGGLPLGSGDFQTTFELAVGGGVPSWKLGFESAVGYNKRSEGISDGLLFRLQFFREFWRKLTIGWAFFGRHSLRNGDPGAGRPSRVGTFVNNQEYLAYGPRLGYKLSPRWSVTFEGDGAVSIKNVHQGLFPRFGVSYQTP